MSHVLTPRPAASRPVAGLDRRFYAFMVDRLIAWTLVAAACWAAYELFWSDDQIWAGVALVAGVVVVVWVGFAVALGVVGTTPGKAAVGVRAVHVGTGTPIGFGRALLRGLVLGVATIPTFGIGLATLAWTAVADPTRRRRGWHDHVAQSIVVDLRPEPSDPEEADSGPRHVVNLTAMRLVPAPPQPADAGRTAPGAAHPGRRDPTTRAGAPVPAVGVPESAAHRAPVTRRHPDRCRDRLGAGLRHRREGARRRRGAGRPAPVGRVPARPCGTWSPCRRRTCRCRRRTPRSASPATVPSW